ncbi:hypothetical protein MMC11_004681 [Xylographa trunciseda]|nr:hypothetical protein [Xylographa trunciseda]
MAKSTESPLTASFEERVTKALEEWHVPGISIAVVHNDEVFAEGYGIAKFPSEKVTPATLFYAGSTTKAFLGTAWAQLIESEGNQKKNAREKISYDTPLADLMRDDFVLPNEYSTAHCSIEDALSHRSGMFRHESSYGGEFDTPQKIVRSLRHLPLNRELRTHFEYCNQMYIAASHALETVTGEWLGKTLKEGIWDPLEMKSTFLALGDARKAVESGDLKLAQGYLHREAGGECKQEEYEPEAPMSFPEISGAGCIISNVLDYAKWIKAWLNQSAPLSEKIVTAVTTPRSIMAPSEKPWDGAVTYSLGWSECTYEGERVLTHSGALIGFGAKVLILPNRKWGAALFANTAITSNCAAEALVMHLVDELLELPAAKRFEGTEKSSDLLKKNTPPPSKTKKDLYPNALEPGKPHTLPLEDYAGKYHHPGYRYITFQVQERTNKETKETSQVLFADLQDRTWPFTITMEHVTNEYWIAVVQTRFQPMMQKAEFRIGADGKVTELGIAMESGMPDTLMWFKKVSS